jgi:AcrR family transcriptional regulator
VAVPEECDSLPVPQYNAPHNTAEDARKRKQLEKIIESAIRVFSDRGYKEARMSHIAGEAGIAPGTLYLYFEGKESLFNFLLKHIFSDRQNLDEVAVPIKSSSWDAGLSSGKNAFVSSKLSALFEGIIHGAGVEDVHEEFEKIIRNLFSTMSTYRHGITILMKSSLNWPQLADFYFTTVRDFLDLLTAYLDKRIDQGLIRKVPNVPASARFIVGSIAWFAVHRHRVVHQDVMSEDLAEETVVDALMNAYIPEHLRGPHRAKT